MDLKERLEEGLKAALKAGRKTDLATIRLTLSDLKNAEKDKRRPLDERELVQLIRSAAKKRKEAIELFRKGGRDDLVKKEEAELRLLEDYLPAAPPEEDLKALIREAIGETGASSPRDLGKIMKYVMPKLEGRADGNEVNRIAREMMTEEEEAP